jgi:hypothetical protein
MGNPFRGMSRRRRRLTIGATVIALLALPASMVFASHTFSDVPTSAFYHDDVDTLVNAGITAGCGSGKYCPNNAVTRGQMAVFLNKLGALGDGTLTNVDALSVNGIVPEFARPSNLTVSGTPTSYCETRDNATGAEDFIAWVQLVNPPSGAINDYETWVDYAGVDPDQFKVCVAREDNAALTASSVFGVQIGTLEFLGQGLFASSSGARKAQRTGAQVREAHEK